jgi:catalase
MSDNREPRGSRACPERGFTSAPTAVEGARIRERSETFADHYSQARQFYISQTAVEQNHMANALTFELSKCERMDIRERMIGHLRHIDEELAREVCDGIGLAKLPGKTPLAKEPITDLPESPALSIVKNGPGSFKGRKLGIYIAEGGDADVVKALQDAAKDAGGMAEIIAPHVAGAKLSDGRVMEADEKIDGGPSVVYDAVAVVMSEDSARRYNADKPSLDFVNDAFAHAKFVAYVPDVQPLFECAGVWKWMDDGFVDVSATGAADSFIEKCGQLRFWDRQAVKQD